MVDITVAICTFNGEHRLPKVLDKLLCQTNTNHFAWEVVVVDNNSSDKTAKIVQQYQQNWLEASPLKYYFEPRQGCAFARRLAVKVAEGKLIRFLDDDNWPTADWAYAAAF